MRASNRIVVNTIAQYIRTIINLILSLYSSRLVLNILGVEDYGIYSLVAGVVSMLSFITNSLQGSTQRFLSVSQGHGDIENLKVIFGNSVILHIIVGFLVLIVLECIMPFLFDGFLNIPDNRRSVAKLLFHSVAIMVYVSFVAAPYKALLISRENIVYTSVVDVLDGIFKVVFVLILPYMPFDKLSVYGFIMLSINLFNLIAYVLYSHIKYEEAVLPRFKSFRLSFVKELSSFTGWMLYSTVCITLKTQGVAVVLNKAFGTAINAAYGIGQQISGLVSFVSSSFNNAINPQLMSSAGSGNLTRMWFLAEVESKFSFLLLSMVGIPTMFEMPYLLKIWLGNSVPENTALFATTLLLAQIVDMLSTGLAQVNKAIGKVGFYTFMTYSPKLLVLPLSWIMLRMQQPLWSVCAVIIFFEALCVFIRIWLFRKDTHFQIGRYIYSVILKSMTPVLVSCSYCYMIRNVSDEIVRLIVTYIGAIPIFVITTYYITLTEREKSVIKGLLSKFKR